MSWSGEVELQDGLALQIWQHYRSCDPHSEVSKLALVQTPGPSVTTSSLVSVSYVMLPWEPQRLTVFTAGLRVNSVEMYQCLLEQYNIPHVRVQLLWT